VSEGDDTTETRCAGFGRRRCGRFPTVRVDVTVLPDLDELVVGQVWGVSFGDYLVDE
jgi:hypothetical protein